MPCQTAKPMRRCRLESPGALDILQHGPQKHQHGTTQVIRPEALSVQGHQLSSATVNKLQGIGYQSFHHQAPAIIRLYLHSSNHAAHQTVEPRVFCRHTTEPHPSKPPALSQNLHLPAGPSVWSAAAAASSLLLALLHRLLPEDFTRGHESVIRQRRAGVCQFQPYVKYTKAK